MKLFTRYNRVNIATTIITFVVGSIAFYFVLNYLLISQLDRSLHVEQTEIIDFVNQHDRIPDPLTTKHQWTEYITATKPIADPKATTTEAFNKLEMKQNLFVNLYSLYLQVATVQSCCKPIKNRN